MDNFERAHHLVKHHFNVKMVMNGQPEGSDWWIEFTGPANRLWAAAALGGHALTDRGAKCYEEPPPNDPDPREPSPRDDQGISRNKMPPHRRHNEQSDVESRKGQLQMICRPTFFPGPLVMFGFTETVSIDTVEECMEAARRVACVLSVHELPGFEDVLQYLEVNHQRDLRNWRKTHQFEVCDPSQDTIHTVRDALCIISDTDNIPIAARIGAAKCGGVRPGKEGYGPLACSEDGPELADPANDVYGFLMDQVLQQTDDIPPHHTRQAALDRLEQFSP